MNTTRHIFESLSRLRQVVLLLVLFTLCSMKGWADGSLLDGKKWTRTDLGTNKPSSGFMSGGMQGAAIYNGNMYQFRNNAGNDKNVTYDIYNVSAGTWTTGGTLTCINNSHAGSANFGTKVFTTSNSTYGQDCTIPFLYLTNGQTIQIVDVEHDALVATWTLASALQDDAISAFDFANGTLWSIGYVSGSRKAPYIVRVRTGLDFTTVPTNQTITFTDAEKTSIGGPDAQGIQRDLLNGTLQDCQYVDGKIYICFGGGSSAHRTEHCGVHVYDTSSNSIVETKLCTADNEAEGFVYDATSQTFVMTTLNAVWKLSAGSGYDTQYNFEPATKNGDYYEISNASQLLWFKQQVYGGRTDIKARLTTDIDMSGVIDPFSYYVYDYNIALAGKSTPTYPATFAFRGELDGDYHTISNYTITKTPYYYCGLLPYCIGANIHDITVTGSIKLSTCDAMVLQDGSWKALSTQPVSNVGLIGYMDGGSVTNVNTIGFTIDTSVVGDNYNTSTVSNLIGGRGTNSITESGNETTDADHPTHAAHKTETGEDHKYVNGICQCSDACSAKYETPTQDGEYYMLSNAGHLFWFANQVQTTQSAKAKLANDINLEYIEFPGIGSSSKVFTGSFDGQGYTIQRYKYNCSSATQGQGFFNQTGANAVLKNFTLKGEMLFDNSNAPAFVGAVVGIATSTTIQDVTSSVSLNLTANSTGGTNGVRIVGGIAGSMRGGTINRCRYNGTMSINGSTATVGDRFAGIAGDVRTSATTISNCLFDGKIECKKQSISIAGILAKLEGGSATLSNCLSVGTLTLVGNSSNCGMIVGSGSPTVTNCQYIIDNLTKDGANITSGFTASGTKLNASYNWQAITTSLNPAGCNWKIVSGQDYPLPFNNGFISNTEFEEPAQDAEGYYLIDNGGKMWWFAKYVKNTDKAAKAKLTADIDIEGNTRCTGSTNMPQMGDWGSGGDGAFTGTFDGQGYTISNWQQNWNNSSRSGLFGYTQNATIKNFTLEGTLTATGGTGAQQIGSVVGYNGTGSTLEDVHSKVNINANGGIWAIGGIVGRAGGVVNRCWYSGTITADANTYRLIGGIAGDTYKQNSSEYISNCLFDGTIIAPSSSTDLTVGGIAGGASEVNGEIKNCLMNGTITLANYAGTKSGYIVGSVEKSGKTINIQSTYYRIDGVSATITASHGTTTGTINDESAKVTTRSNLTNGQLVINLGSANWEQGDGEPIPLVGGGEHHHVYNLNGFCLAGDGYESVGDPVDGWYEIGNGGQLFDFATKFNTGAIDAAAKVKLTADINLEGKLFPGIGVFVGAGHTPGTGSYVFTGEFDGQGYTIKKLYRSCTSSCTGGLFNTVNDAKIYNFHIRGTLVTPSDNTRFGGVIGYAYGSNSLIEDIYSSVDITANGSTGVVGGVIGRAQGTINRCRYDGTITGSNLFVNQAAGICANARSGLTISNCLFDGDIEMNYAGSSTTDVRVGGILAWNDGGNIALLNNLSNGTIHLKEGTENSKNGLNLCGIVYGDVSTTNTKDALTVSDNYYTITNCTVGTTAFTQAGGKTKTGATVGDGCTLRDTQDWNPTILDALNGSSNPKNWVIDTEVYPIPAKTAYIPPVNYTIVFKDYDGTILKTSVVEEGDEVMAPEDPTRSGYIFADWSPAVVSPAVADATYIATYNKVGYKNGFNTDMEHCLEADRYEVPSQDAEGNYLIANGGQLFWFAHSLNGTSGLTKIDATSKALLTVDIDLEGKAFPGITTYSGTFDGQEHKISGFVMDKTDSNARTGMFCTLSGSAVVKKFTLVGSRNIAGSQNMHGAVVGSLQGSSLLEDVISKVNLTNNDATSDQAILGGLAGAVESATAKINRCTYSGTITVGTKLLKQIGGIAGNVRGGTISNCLFNGTIISSSNSADLNFGGIAGSTSTTDNSKIKNCLVNGTLTITNYSGTKSGIVFGAADKSLTISDTYYTTKNVSGIPAVVGTGTVTPTQTTVADATSMTSATLLSKLLANSGEWEIKDEEVVPGNVASYTITFKDWDDQVIQTGQVAANQAVTLPVDPTREGYAFTGWSPTVVSPPVADATYTAQYTATANPHTITFDTDGGSTVDSITQEEGSAVTAPANPTKTGYNFAGWIDESGTATTVPATMPDHNVTLKATWTVNQYTITFNVDGGTPEIAAITQDYGTDITAPANPTKEGWYFNGWSPTVPATMPAENITCVAQWSQDSYTNGFNDDWNTCEEAKKYEEPVLITAARCAALGIDESYATNGYYEVKNAGNMFWISKNFSASNNNRKYVVTADIDMEGNKNIHQDWKGISAYIADGSTHFTGTFDGLGHKFTNYYRAISSGNINGMFNCVQGATIKNFSIEGNVYINGNVTQTGVIIGRVAGGDKTQTTLEDIHSNVSIEVKASTTPSSIGGLIGQVSGKTSMNRCRYSGTITGNSAFAGLGGIIGNGENPITLDNCLFDGTISTSSTQARTGVDDGIKIGGLCGRNNNTTKITNSMSIGTISVSEAADKGNVGIILGTQTNNNKLTITNTYYSTSNCTSGIGAVGNNSNTDKTSAAPTELSASPDWTVIRKTLSMSNWVIDQEKYGKEYPIPAVFVCTHGYNQYGFCTECEAPEPIGNPDADGYYQIDHLADLAQFAAMVNGSANGTEINAKVTADIDLTGYGKTLTTTIGDKDHHYCGTFDGQGYSMKGITVESNQRYVGLFACVGIKDTDASKVKNGIVKNFSVSGNVTATYFSEWNNNSPLVMGVIGEVYSGTIENVHSSVDFACTSGTRSHIGGVVGGSLHMSSEAGEIVIKNCTYEGRMTLNACDAIGGILGYAQHKTKISNTMFSGSITQNYTRNDNEKDGSQSEGTVSTYIGGALGYCNSATDGVQNCVLAGTMTTNLTITSDGTMKKPGNNLNAVVGFDGQINDSYRNYTGNYVTTSYNTNYHQYPTSKFDNTAKVRSDAQFVTGAICAELNADATATDNPWGQILGYQVGANKDPNSPAQAYPYPGYTDPSQTTYRVVRAQNTTDNTKYDYTADYYFFDDYGDTYPTPEDAASLRAKKIVYTRQPSTLSGYMSVCLPFEFTEEMKPSTNAKLYQYGGVNGSNAVFHEINVPIDAGTPFVMKDGSTWNITIDNTDTSLAVDNPSTDNSSPGLYGTYETTPIGEGYWKLKYDGTKFVKSVSNSKCYPFRGYLKLPTTSSTKEFFPLFEDGVIDGITFIDAEPADADEPRYNLMGQRVGNNAKGIVIIGGKKVLNK